MLPSGWKTKTADELCIKISKGTTPQKSEIVDNSSIPFLRVNNLSFDGVLDKASDFIYVSKNAHLGILARSKAYPNDVLINIVGPPLGKTTLLDDTYLEYNMNQAIVFFRINTELLNSFFFISYLRSHFALHWLLSRSKKTSGQQNLTIQVCKELPVPVPPLQEQKKIANNRKKP